MDNRRGARIAVTDQPPPIDGLEPKREPHELHVTVDCNEEDVEPLEVTGRGVLVIVMGTNGDARVVTPYVHALSAVDLWGVRELIDRLAEELWEQALEAQTDDPDENQPET